jgi:hypothetical protein
MTGNTIPFTIKNSPNSTGVSPQAFPHSEHRFWIFSIFVSKDSSSLSFTRECFNTIAIKFFFIIVVF